jgi:hypothetical protein
MNSRRMTDTAPEILEALFCWPVLACFSEYYPGYPEIPKNPHLYVLLPGFGRDQFSPKYPGVITRYTRKLKHYRALAF